MPQQGWIFLDDFGRRHKVGLYHGDSSGHVVIHVNEQIVKVDFNVKASKSYSFFIEEELCEIVLENTPTGFTYDFQRNRSADTPLNRERKKENRLNARKLALLLGGIVLFIGGALALLKYMENNRRVQASFFTPLSKEYEKLLSEKGRPAVARLTVTEEARSKRITYAFLTENGQTVSKTFEMPDSARIVLPNGFYLSNGDEFNAAYLPNMPEVHRIRFLDPTEKQIGLYIAQAAISENRFHPEISLKKARCIAEHVVARAGWERLADLIFQNQSPEQNPRHNRDSYARLIREPRVKAAFDAFCWDK